MIFSFRNHSLYYKRMYVELVSNTSDHKNHLFCVAKQFSEIIHTIDNCNNVQVQRNSLPRLEYYLF